MTPINITRTMLLASCLLFWGCTETGSSPDAGSSTFDDAGTAGVVDAATGVADAATGVADAALPDDASVDSCQPTPLPSNGPEPSSVAPGTVCTGDDDCVTVGGFCRPLAIGGSECAAFQGIGGSCGGLTAPADQELCVEGLECESVDILTVGNCVCTPSCDGRSCGPDGCGGSCGSCENGDICISNASIPNIVNPVQACTNYEGNRCCNPIVVDTLPFKRTTHFPSEDAFAFPGGSDTIFQFTPTESGDYFIWGGRYTCERRAVYESCDPASSPIAMMEPSCETEISLDRPLLLSLEAGEDYFPVVNSGVLDVTGPVVTIDDSNSVIAGLKTDATHIYWIVGNTIFRRAIDGSGVTAAVMASVGEIFAFELEGDKVYAIDQGSGLLLEGLKTGGAPTVIASGQPLMRSLTVSDQYVYWSTAPSADFTGGCGVRFDNSVRRILRSGGTIEDVAVGQAIVTDLASDDTHVYWTLRRHENFGPPPGGCPGPGIRRRSHAGGAIEPMAEEFNHISLIVTDTDIYASIGSDEGASTHFNFGVPYIWHRYDKATLELMHAFNDKFYGIGAVHDGTNFYANAPSETRQNDWALVQTSETGDDIQVAPTGGFGQLAVSDEFLIFSFLGETISIPKP